MARKTVEDHIGAEATLLPEVPMGHVLVQFVTDHEVQDELRGTANATIWRGGTLAALPEASALHFIRRGKAVAVEV